MNILSLIDVHILQFYSSVHYTYTHIYIYIYFTPIYMTCISTVYLKWSALCSTYLMLYTNIIDK